MAFLSVIIPSPQIYLRTMLHAVGRAENDAELRTNLRLIAAILLAHWSDTNPDLNGIRGHIFDIATNEHFYQEGYAKSTLGGIRSGDYDITPEWANVEAKYPTGIARYVDERLWFCSYVGFEKVTSEWAKKNHPDCKGYICMRLYNQDERNNELDSHTIQLYF